MKHTDDIPDTIEHSAEQQYKHMPPDIAARVPPIPAMLNELAEQALPQILGNTTTIISNRLPYPLQHILCKNTTAIYLVCLQPTPDKTFFHHAFAAWHDLQTNLHWLHALHPELHQPDQPVDDIRLILLSPTPLPGQTLLSSSPLISAINYTLIDLDNEQHMIIDDNTLLAPSPNKSSTDHPALNKEENIFFNQAEW